MKREELLEKVNKLKWLQCIELPTDEGDTIVTPGVFDHCTEEIATNRYGLPNDLNGKSVLDIGGANGFHSFLAIKRGACVTCIEPSQGGGDNYKALTLAAEAIDTNLLTAYNGTLESYLIRAELVSWVNKFDIVFFYGVLYHVDDPLTELRRVSEVTLEGGIAIIETAIAQRDYQNWPVWELNPGFDGDKTNKWYPTIAGLNAALKEVGFKQTEVIYNDGIRMTMKCFK